MSGGGTHALRTRARAWAWLALTVGPIALVVVRVLVMPVTFDEALTWEERVLRGWRELFSWYTTNHHVLHSLLVKLSVTLLGDTLFALRLPSLLGGVLYVLCVASLCRTVLGSGALGLAAQAALVTNPLVVDFLGLARGYGLALGFEAAAFALAARGLAARVDGHAPKHWPQRLALGSLALAAMVSANPAFAPAGIGLALALAVVWLRAGRPSRREVATAALAALVPGLVLSVPLSIPLLHATRENFYLGLDSLWTSATSLLSYCVAYHWDAGVALPPAVERLVAATTATALGGGTALGLGALVVACRCRALGMPFVLCAVLLVDLAMTLGMHVVLGTLYPFGRTALRVVLPFCMALGALPRGRAARAVSALVLWALAAWFGWQLRWDSTRDWRPEAAQHRLRAHLKELAQSRGGELRVGSDWFLRIGMRYLEAHEPPGGPRLTLLRDGESVEPADALACIVVLAEPEALANGRYRVRIQANIGKPERWEGTLNWLDRDRRVAVLVR